MVWFQSDSGDGDCSQSIVGDLLGYLNESWTQFHATGTAPNPSFLFLLSRSICACLHWFLLISMKIYLWLLSFTVRRAQSIDFWWKEEFLIGWNLVILMSCSLNSTIMAFGPNHNVFFKVIEAMVIDCVFSWGEKAASCGWFSLTEWEWRVGSSAWWSLLLYKEHVLLGCFCNRREVSLILFRLSFLFQCDKHILCGHYTFIHATISIPNP